MINNDYKQNNSKRIQAAPINTGGFQRIEDNGNIVYHWVDTAIEHLSSAKLWDILRLARVPDCEIDQDFANQVTRELKQRNHFDENQPWMKPH
jgi:hypothetical protein